MTNAEIILTVGVGVWTATNVVFASIKICNERRDAVLLGTLDKALLTRRHKVLIVYSDWLPMFVGVGLLCIGASATLAALPWWVTKVPSITIEPLYVTISSAVGFAFLAFISASMVIGGIAEYLMLRSALKRPDAPQI
jgi:hypothetical protein